MTVGWPKLRLAEAIRSIVFFGLLYLYLWQVVQPCLIYGCAAITNFPVFYKGWPFFWECLSYPGGLLRYLCALLPQFFYHSWAGALVITGQAWAIFVCTGWLLRALGVPGCRLLRFVPPLLVLVTYSQYTYHFPTITGSLAALLFGCLYVTVAARAQTESVGCAVHTASPDREGSWCARHTLQISLAVYLVLSVASYVVSAAAYLPFAVLCVVYELLYRRRYLVGLVYALLAAVLPYGVGVLLFHVSIVNAYTDLLPLSWQARDWLTRGKMLEVVYALYLFPIVAGLVWGLGQGTAPWLKSRRHGVRAKETRGLRTHPTRWLKSPAVRWSLGSVVLFAISGVVAFWSLDREQGARLAVHYYASQHMWPEVLHASRRCGDNLTVINAVDRALYHTGRFQQDLFSYLQHPDALLFTGDDHSMAYWHKFDTLIDLGLMNLAEKNLTECVETFGEQPMILQRLAIVNLAKGKIAAARIYLERLQKTLFFSRWAKDYLGRLEADPTLATDTQVQQWRASSLRQDSIAGFFAREPMLAALAEQGGNRMAFEYLMGWYMVNKRIDKLVQNLRRLPEFGYTEIPPLYQEAVVIYATKNPVPLGGFSINPQVQQRIKRFTDIFNRSGKNKEAAFGELSREFAGSYFLYFIYADTPTQK